MQTQNGRTDGSLETPIMAASPTSSWRLHSAQRVGFSPWYRDEFQGSYRQWQLHVWELRGPAATWPEQLAAYYQAQPVFAVLSVIEAGDSDVLQLAKGA